MSISYNSAEAVAFLSRLHPNIPIQIVTAMARRTAAASDQASIQFAEVTGHSGGSL